MNAGKFLFGAAIGAAIGAAAVLLNAPTSGEQLRNNIKSNTNSMKLQLTDVKHEGTNVKYAIQTLTNEIKNNMPVIINDFKNSFAAFQKEIAPNVEKLQSEIDGLNTSIQKIQEDLNDFNKKPENSSI